MHLEGLSGHAVTLSEHAERMWDLDEVDLDLFLFQFMVIDIDLVTKGCMLA